jgi:hypothetical protein
LKLSRMNAVVAQKAKNDAAARHGGASHGDGGH